MFKIKTLSIVIPLFNESKRIQRTLPIIENEVRKIEASHGINVELICVNDGSGDDTSQTIRNLSKLNNLKIIDSAVNKGKGFALKNGFLEATGSFILFMDADLSTPVEFIEKFIQQTEDDKTILIGSRKISRDLMKIKQPFIRRKMGQVFTFLSNFILGTSISDFTCGFKMFPQEAGKKIFRNLRIKRWGFDVEALYLAKRFGYPIKEIPVSWYNDPDTKVKLIRDTCRSLTDLIKIKFNSWSKVYDS